MKERLRIKGTILLKLLDQYGKIKTKREINNLVVTTGKSHIVSRMLSNSNLIINQIEVGTDQTRAVLGDTALRAAVAGSKITVDSYAQFSQTFANDSVRYDAVFAAGVGTGSLKEIGLFNSQYMFSRAVFDEIVKDSLDTLEITWIITFA